MTAPNPRLLELSNEDRQELESWLVEFDQRWGEGLLSGRVNQIPPGSSWRLTALAEMVKIDLERQWQNGRRVSLESYLKDFPELGGVGDVSVDLIQAEYEVRRQFGVPATLENYSRRFPGQFDDFCRLSGQGGSSPSRRSASARNPSAPGSSRSASARRPAYPARELPWQFGRYRIIRGLGRGGMGSVYLAEDTELGRRVALKVAHVEADESLEARERFTRQARAAATLDHPYLCPVYDLGSIDGIRFLTMAYIEGNSLASSIRDEGLPPRQVAALAGKLAVAL